MVNSIVIAWPTYDPSTGWATTAAISSNIVAKHKPAGGSRPMSKVLGLAVESLPCVSNPSMLRDTWFSHVQGK